MFDSRMFGKLKNISQLCRKWCYKTTLLLVQLVLVQCTRKYQYLCLTNKNKRL